MSTTQQGDPTSECRASAFNCASVLALTRPNRGPFCCSVPLAASLQRGSAVSVQARVSPAPPRNEWLALAKWMKVEPRTCLPRGVGSRGRSGCGFQLQITPRQQATQPIVNLAFALLENTGRER